MVFWAIYLISSCLICYLFSNFLPRKRRILIFFITLTIMVTPATIEQNSNELAPSIFIFFYDLFLEQSFSARSLRPIALTLPIAFLLSIIFIKIKKVFSQT